MACSAPVIRLVYGNRIDMLARALARALDAREDAGVSPLTPTHVVVPNRHLQRYLEIELARARGFSANLRFHRLDALVAGWLRSETGAGALGRRDLLRALLGLFTDPAAMDEPALEPVRRYLDTTGEAGSLGARQAQLALRMARLYEGYLYGRPELIAAWERGAHHLADTPMAETERWQRALYDRLRAREPGAPLPEVLRRLAETIGGGSLPDAVHVFGLSYVARVFQWAYGLLGRRTQLHLYVPNPCQEFWEDLPAATEAEIAEGPGEPPLLSWWGRPGREHVRLTSELTDGVFEDAFADPVAAEGTLLRTLQEDVLRRRPPPAEPPCTLDGTVRALACSGVRRELETVAEAIWQAVRADPSLRFNEIAVFVPPDARAAYLPQLSAVFEAAGQLPHHVVDLPLASASMMVEAASLLLRLPRSPFRRTDVLAVATHPCVRVPGGSSIDRSGWPRLIDRLGAFHDRASIPEGYAASDLLDWDQAIRRLTLGAFMEGERAGEERPFGVGAERHRPEDASRDQGGPALALLLRALANEASLGRGERRSLTEWGAHFRELFASLLEPLDAAQERELRRCLAAADRLGELDATGAPVEHRLAAELVEEALARLGGARGEYLAEGVVVGALAPMRAIPFRRIFVLGLGEGRFPSAERRDPLDLRQVGRKLGDVTPPERDKYVFLEALLAAREQVVLSWVGRDPTSGERVAPSSVVQQLIDLVRQSYVADGALIEEVPLRRHQIEGSVSRSARRERAAAEAGSALREAVGRRLEADELLELAEVDPQLAQKLVLWRVPRESAPAERMRVGIATLRRFLESPAQGWARAVVGLLEPDDESSIFRDEEPLRPERLARATMLREVFGEALPDPFDPGRYQARVRELQERGRWPLGPLAVAGEQVDRAALGGWDRLRRSALESASPSRHRFGTGASRGDADRVHPPLELELELERGTVTVELIGRTEVLVDEGRASLVLIPKDPPSGIGLARERLFYGLRGFLDHVVLRAAGIDPGAGHRTLVAFAGPTGSQDASLRFRPLEPGHARQLLGRWLTDLLSEAHAYFLPCEAVFEDPRGWRTLTPEKLEQALAKVRRRGGRWHYGPLPADRVAALPAPPAEEALALVQGRFGAYFQLAGLAS